MTTKPPYFEQNVREQFRRYVQRVAFQLTLSAPMIACLKYVRDDPGYGSSGNIFRARGDYDNVRALNTGSHIFVTEIKALERRGMVYWDPPPEKEPWREGHRTFKLTRIGELTCELCVEAGLMPQRISQKRRKAA
jgi:hypothetical protein